MKTKKLFPFYIGIALLAASCTKSPLNSSSYNNLPPANNVASLGGTKWVLFQYKGPGMQTPQSLSDTLIFTDATNYTYNHVAGTYNIKNNLTLDQAAFELDNTPFGNLYGLPPVSFTTYGQITDVSFQRINTSNNAYSLWMKKL